MAKFANKDELKEYLVNAWRNGKKMDEVNFEATWRNLVDNLSFDNGTGLSFSIKESHFDADGNTIVTFTDNSQIVINAGKKGNDGLQGPDGKSAYQLAIDSGFVGSESEWLASLKGDQGPKGDPGDSATLPIASNTTLGGVKIGSGLSIDGSGLLSATQSGQSGNSGLMFDKQNLSKDFSPSISISDASYKEISSSTNWPMNVINIKVKDDSVLSGETVVGNIYSETKAVIDNIDLSSTSGTITISVRTNSAIKEQAEYLKRYSDNGLPIWVGYKNKNKSLDNYKYVKPKIDAFDSNPYIGDIIGSVDGIIRYSIRLKLNVPNDIPKDTTTILLVFTA